MILQQIGRPLPARPLASINIRLTGLSHFIIHAAALLFASCFLSAPDMAVLAIGRYDLSPKGNQPLTLTW